MNGMSKSILTPEQQKFFDDNFDRIAYQEAKANLLKRISEADSFESFWRALDCFENHDIDYTDTDNIVYCDIELDRKRMNTDASYVGVTFILLWLEREKKAVLNTSILYSNQKSQDEFADMLCYIDPDTCEVINWVYGVDIDYEQ